jgi:hypothetical protein
MFETIGKEAASSGGGGTPQWMSSHPNPGNRTVYITKEAESLTIANAADSSQFAAIKTAFASLPAPRTMEELAKGGGRGGGGGGGGGGEPGFDSAAAVGTPGQPVPKPSGQYRAIAGGKVFQASVPSEWTALPSSSSIKVVPQNGYGQLNGQTVFSHGVEFGLLKAPSRDLQEATKAWLQAVGQANPEMRLAGEQQQVRISQRTALMTPIVNPSQLGGKELIGVYTTFLADGTMFYYLTVVPESDDAAFREAFRRIVESIKLTEVQ